MNSVLKSKISASIMCGDMMHFSEVVKDLEAASIDLITSTLWMAVLCRT